MIEVSRYGFRKLNARLRHLDKSLKRYLKKIVRNMAGTAKRKALELAPRDTGEYRRTIITVIKSALRARLIATRSKPSKRFSTTKGFLGSILEYGKKDNSLKPLPHLKPALMYAESVHKNDLKIIETVVNRLLKEFA